MRAKVAEGAAVLERWTGELGGDPLIGFTLRAYDPELGKWSVWLNWHGGKPGGFSPMQWTREVAGSVTIHAELSRVGLALTSHAREPTQSPS